jgi:alpha-glucosidase
MSFGAEGGELNYYVIAGPGPRDVLARYTALTGRIELPPKWAIGYHQCRYSYYPEERVREVARTFREKRIPCDVLWFDIDYMDGYRVFTWDPERFPDPKQLNADLEALGFHTIAIIDPCVKQDPDYALYREGTALSAWVTTPEGEPYVGRVWPGECTFPDFTNSEVRTWWAAQYPRFLLESGLDGVWNDMNEPADFAGPNKTLPLDVCFANQGNPASHRAAHNVYGMLMAGAAHEGLRRAYLDRRPFTLTRATFAGGQRYGALWTGDNLSTFEHLRMSIAMVASLGMSGMPFVGPDIGGFASGATPALYARWLNAAALFPFARTHTGSNSPDQEPWSYGKEIEAIARKALERRYQWLPYIYTLFEECARTGVPIIRPVWMEISNSPDWLEDTTFFLGPHVYVAPILQAEEIPYGVYLPEGVWFDGNTGLVHGGQRFVNVPGSLDVLPHFFRAGAIVPMQSTIQHTSETPEHPLIIDVWPWGASQGELYEDDGISPAYRDGAFRRTRFTCVREAGTVVFTMHAAEGSYEPPPRSPVVRLHGLRVEGYAITGSVEMNPGWSEAGGLQDPASGAWLFRLGEDKGQEQKLTVTFASAEPPDPEPIEFETAASAIEQVHHLSTPQIVDGAAVLHVRRPDSPYILLPRLYFAAQEYPMLKIRMSTEHARTLSVRFATEEQPDRLGGEKSALSLTPDGEFHDYAFDLGEAVEGWGGTVFRLELHWRDGVRPNERIRIDRIEFAER